MLRTVESSHVSEQLIATDYSEFEQPNITIGMLLEVGAIRDEFLRDTNRRVSCRQSGIQPTLSGISSYLAIRPDVCIAYIASTGVAMRSLSQSLCRP